ncbi:TPA: HIT family protein [Candidatus Woesearchaeota archaeon]|nr:HIT family protein [Candidatus Woesearchaeota archaeon]
MSETEEKAKEEKNVLYEDEKIVAFVPQKPFVKGHIVVRPKEEQGKIQEMDEKDFGHLIYGASFAATALFENLQAHGTNIIMNTGSQIGENKKGLKVDVLARWAEDGLKLMWTPKKIPDGEMQDIASKIKDKIPVPGVKKEKEVLNLDEKKIERIEETVGKDTKKGHREEKAKEEDKKETPEKKKEESKDKNTATKETKKEERKDTDEDKESYLVKQLKRMP